ncbi:bursicon [Stomoxys calcitrans]|uniref:bursicon n=1 Tax=Stomoxys calcitrans TaxID=35570 RepID=UPI0027E39836|nr:bursicon [Stomoxys calcitrans]
MATTLGLRAAGKKLQCGFLSCCLWLLLLQLYDSGGRHVLAENAVIADDNDISHIGDDCQVTPVIHVLQYPGCVPKPIPSFACVGRCASYIQVSGSKIWQMERSCMCCQESGEREAAVSLFCPKVKHGERKFKKVLTKAPLECMCRPCTAIEESGIVPQEIAGYSDEGPLNNHFRRIALQ